MPAAPVTIRTTFDAFIVAAGEQVAPELRALALASPASMLSGPLSGPAASDALRSLMAAHAGMPFMHALHDSEVVAWFRQNTEGLMPRLLVLPTAGAGRNAGSQPAAAIDGVSGQVRPDLAITDAEWSHIENGDVRAFWLSRLDRLDPIARIGFGLWSSSAREFRERIEHGDPAYWNHRGFVYWESMVRSTVVNLSAGLTSAGFRGNMREERQKILEVGRLVAEYHARFVEEDYQRGYGRVPGLLSAQQVADYHHLAFEAFGIRPDFYGGTPLRRVPDSVEFRIFGFLYCHDCDTAEGYPAAAGAGAVP